MRKLFTTASLQQGNGNVADFFAAWTYLNLWFACLHVVVEGWHKSHARGLPLTDDVIDRLLASAHAQRLRRFRNAIFHPEYFNHHAVLEALGNRELLSWAERVTDEFKRFFDEALLTRLAYESLDQVIAEEESARHRKVNSSRSPA